MNVIVNSFGLSVYFHDHIITNARHQWKCAPKKPFKLFITISVAFTFRRNDYRWNDENNCNKRKAITKQIKCNNHKICSATGGMVKHVMFTSCYDTDKMVQSYLCKYLCDAWRWICFCTDNSMGFWKKRLFSVNHSNLCEKCKFKAIQPYHT